MICRMQSAHDCTFDKTTMYSSGLYSVAFQASVNDATTYTALFALSLCYAPNIDT